MFGSKWNTASLSALGVVAAVGLAACDTAEEPGVPAPTERSDTLGQGADPGVVPQSPPQGDLSADDVNTQPPRDTAYEDRLAGAEVPNTGGEVAEGVDSPHNLDGRSITTADGQPLGEVTQVVVDDAQNVFAVIELDSAEAAPNAGDGTVVVDVDDINREQNTLILMSETSDLQPYVPEEYKPLGIRTEP